MSTSEPLPGDQVRALHRMRAWENDNERGVNGVWVEAGQTALVIQVWHAGRTRSRMKLLVNDRIAMFSCRTSDLTRNWPVIGRQSPTDHDP